MENFHREEPSIHLLFQMMALSKPPLKLRLFVYGGSDLKERMLPANELYSFDFREETWRKYQIKDAKPNPVLPSNGFFIAYRLCLCSLDGVAQ